MTSPRTASSPRNFTPQWQRVLLTATGVALAITLAALLLFIWWHTAQLHELASRTNSSESFAWGAIGLMNVFMIRLLAILCGTAVMFGGVATAFFTIERDIKMSGGATHDKSALKGALATASPGVVAVLAGAVVIGMAVNSRVDSQFTPSATHTEAASATGAAKVGSPSPKEWTDTAQLDRAYKDATAQSDDAKATANMGSSGTR